MMNLVEPAPPALTVGLPSIYQDNLPTRYYPVP